MPKLIDCVRGNLSEGDWYLWWDENGWWETGRMEVVDGEPSIRLSSGTITDLGWVAYKGYRIVHK